MTELFLLACLAAVLAHVGPLAAELLVEIFQEQKPIFVRAQK